MIDDARTRPRRALGEEKMPKKIIQRKIYTDDEKERAVNLAKVIGPSKTSQLLNMNPKSVRKWVLRDKEGHFTSLQSYTDETKERAVKLAAEVGVKKAAEYLNISISNIYSWRKTLDPADGAQETRRENDAAAAPETEKTVEDLRETLDAAGRDLHETHQCLTSAFEVNRAVIAANSKAVFDLQKTVEDLRATLDATRREMVVFNATADELKSELRNLKTAVELLTETLLDTAQAAAPLVIPTITPGDATC